MSRYELLLVKLNCHQIRQGLFKTAICHLIESVTWKAEWKIVNRAINQNIQSARTFNMFGNTFPLVIFCVCIPCLSCTYPLFTVDVSLVYHECIRYLPWNYPLFTVDVSHVYHAHIPCIPSTFYLFSKNILIDFTEMV